MKKFVSEYGSTERRNHVLLALVFFGLIVLGRIVYLQVFHADFLVEQGNNRFIRVKKEPALRGTITDRNGVPLAVSTPVSSIWVNPKEISQHPDDIRALSQMIGYAPNRLVDKVAQKKTSSFMYVKRSMEPELAKHVIDKKLPGVYSQREYRRFYPSADVASQIIGFNNIDDSGQEGLELSFNDWLSGTAGSSEIVRDPRGRVVDILEEIKPPVQGQNLALTIDKRIQYLTYAALLENSEKFAAKSATAVVLDAQTSEILAMVSVPSGNPNNPQEKRSTLVKNRAMTDVFEPGSVMKPLVAAVAMDSGLVKPHTPIDTTPGSLRIGRNLVRDTHNYGKLNVSTVIKKSSNVGVCKIALRLPKEKLYAMYSALGFGRKTGINFPGEQSGRLRSMSKLGDFEYCTNAYGYGMSATALQVAHAYATLANNGVQLPVTLVKREHVPVGVRLISKRSAASVRKMLAQAVGEGGTGTRATAGDYIKDYSVGGKTGTVHKVVNGKYSKDQYRSVFAGMAPLSNPKIVMVVVVDDPKGDDYYGGLVAAPVFAKVVGKSLRILGVTPDKKDDSQSIIHIGAQNQVVH
ncbi:MAG: penicillin-binding protein 2 [Gammaproteobacteria bacterium]|nr:penicillin-binding protein 2 [Gammaproteobacteria bacterium]